MAVAVARSQSMLIIVRKSDILTCSVRVSSTTCRGSVPIPRCPHRRGCGYTAVVVVVELVVVDVDMLLSVVDVLSLPETRAVDTRAPSPHQKPRLGGLALAFFKKKPSQSQHEAVNTARPGLAYLGPAWLGLRPQAGPGTSLTLPD